MRPDLAEPVLQRVARALDAVEWPCPSEESGVLDMEGLCDIAAAEGYRARWADIRLLLARAALAALEDTPDAPHD